MQLSELTHPNQLRGLSTGELEDVARQIRERHLEVVSISGGHLGPGLGVVELTLALYQTLDLDRDRIVWDVGHQAYPHKLITGRYGTFDTLRQRNGIAGYSNVAKAALTTLVQVTPAPPFLLRSAWRWLETAVVRNLSVLPS